MSDPAIPQNPGTGLAPQAGPAATTVTGTGISFDFTYNDTDYTVAVKTPDQHGQYGITVTEAPSTAGGTPTTVASFIYAPATSTTTEGFEIAVALPKALQVDSNLTINTLSVNITKGMWQPLS